MLLSFIVFVIYLSCEKNKNKLKEAGFGSFKKEVYRPVLFIHDVIEEGCLQCDQIGRFIGLWATF